MRRVYARLIQPWKTVTYILQVTLMLRVWVLYGRDRKMGIFLSILFVVALVVSLILHSKEPFVSDGSIMYH